MVGDKTEYFTLSLIRIHNRLLILVTLGEGEDKTESGRSGCYFNTFVITLKMHCVL